MKTAKEGAPKVAFIILNWNQCQMTLECLHSIQAITYSHYKVIIVDNGSTDGSVETIRDRFDSCEIIENHKNLGYSEGNNVGIRHAIEQGYDYIFLLNNDTYVDPKMLDYLVEVAEADTGIGIVGPTMFYAEPNHMLWGGENQIDWRRSMVIRHRMGEIIDIESLGSRPPVEVDYIDSCAILIKREVLEKIGLLDGRYFIVYDDLELNLRARKAGYKVYYVPCAWMWHRVSSSMGIGSPATTYYTTRNELLFFSQYSPGLWKWIALINILSRTGRTVAAWTLRSKYRLDIYHRKRAANLLAVRDFLFGQFNQMGVDVAQVCFAK